MWAGLLTDRIDNKSEKSNLINEHGLNREPVPLKFPCAPRHAFVHFCWQPFILLTCRLYINWAHSIMAALIIMTVLQNWCLPSEHNCLYLLASALFLLCALVNILSVQSYSTALIWVCPHFFLLWYSFTRHLCRFFCHMARHLVFSGVRLFVSIMCAWLSYITYCLKIIITKKFKFKF